MLKEVKGLSSDRTVWFLVGAVFLCVLLVLVAVFNHEREKPKSPQALAAAAKIPGAKSGCIEVRPIQNYG